MSIARFRKRLRQAAIRLLVNCVVPLVRVLRKAEEEYDSRLMQKTIEGFSSAGIGLNIDGSATITDPKAVSIGNNVFIGADTFVMSEGGLRIGDNTHISRRVTIYCSDDRFQDGEGVSHGLQRTWKQVTIGANVWIGMNACILPGVTIGDGAIVGMGAIVAKDVPPRAIVGQPPFRILGERLSADNEDAIARRRIGGRNGAIPTGERMRSSRTRGRSHAPDICFILTTGRSGSTTIADALNAHPRVCARHEPRQQLIKWSTEFAHGKLDRDTLMQMLSEMFLDASFYDRDTVHVESDHKHFNLVPLLDELFPACKFIWLIRSALAVVPSTVGRSWYADERHPTWQAIPWYLHEYRLRGDACGAVSPDEWSAMSPFEKNCWYWSHVNGVIERDLRGIPADRKFVMRLEDFAHERAKIFRFLGVEPIRAGAVKSNKAFYSKYSPAAWSQEDRAAFADWCGPLMAQFYPDDCGLQKAS